MRAWYKAGRAACALGVLFLFAGCGHHDASSSTQTGSTDTKAQQEAAAAWSGFVPGVPIQIGHALKAGDLSPTELKYGVAPKHMPGVVYQDNVVLLENGDKLVRGDAGNGLGWALDASDARIKALKVGDIVFATSRCVGRVLSAERNGANVNLILGPVQLTDLVKKGNFSYDEPVDLNSMVVYSAPDYPGAPNSSAAQQMTQSSQTSFVPGGTQRSVSYYAVSPNGEWTPITTRGNEPRLRDAVWHPDDASGAQFLRTDTQLPGVPGVNLPQAPNGFGDIARSPPPPTVQMINGMRMYGCSLDCGGLGLKLYQEKSGVKVWIKAVFHLVNPRLVFRLGIDSGTVNAHVALSGGVGFTVGFDALAAQDMSANIKEVGSVPIDITIPLAGMGVPLTAMFQQSLFLSTGFSAKTSLLHAVADFSASGAIKMDYENGRWNIPPLKMTLKNNLASNVSGLSVGINSLAFAIDQRLLVGVGVLGFAAGPYVNLISSITSLKQASQVPDCRQGTFGMQLGGGIGFAMPKVVATVINFFLGLVHVQPVPSSGYIVKLKNNISLVDLRDEIPERCSG
ncbi:MAG: hypothetical protein ABI129_05380 [Rhodanobacter sp.]